MTPTDHVDPGFAPWSLMTPDPAKAKPLNAGGRTSGAAQNVVHEDKRAPEVVARDGYMFGDDGLTFGDVLDMVNPFQHLPVVGAVYRELTGDEIAPGAKLAGGILYGGPLGLASAAVNNAIEEHSGKDMAGHALAWVGLGGDGAGGEDAGTLAEETLDAPLQTAAAPPAQSGPASAPGLLDLGAQQAAALERFAARMNGDAGAAAGAAPAAAAAAAARPHNQTGGSGSIDTVLARTGPTGKPAGKPGDFGGIARISDEMTRHLALLAQAQSTPAAPEGPGVPSPAAAASLGYPPVNTPSPYMAGPLPQTLDGQSPAANPFVGMAAKPVTPPPEPARPDPFDVALERLGLRKPEPLPNPALTVAAAAGPASGEAASVAPDGVIAAMESALKRYEAMKQDG